ncbi:MAG: hypothetical protein LRS46_01835 [Desulfurococcales archaeon]|nr:hypothetical protein [Desulfurococcales archaeon]
MPPGSKEGEPENLEVLEAILSEEIAIFVNKSSGGFSLRVTISKLLARTFGRGPGDRLYLLNPQRFRVEEIVWP